MKELTACQGKKNFKDFLATLREDRFGMKLDSKNRIFFMLKTHDFFFFGLGCDGKLFRQRFSFHYKRVVTCRDKRIFQSLKNSFIAMMNRGCFSMHQPS